ncbi:MAG: AraC family transcriptional regulator [Parvibaculaceae bacterium]|nr:AraC family transcriptional regulator [Parvibaculaceae bacterium]
MATRQKLKTPGGTSPEANGAQALIFGIVFDRAIGLAIEMGLRPEHFFETISLPPLAPQPTGSRVPLKQLARFLTWAAEASGDDSFGLKLGARFQASDLGAYGYLLLNSSTLGDAMALAQRFIDYQQQGDAFDWKITADGYFEIRYDVQGLEEHFRRHDTECTLAIFHAVAQRLAGRALRPVEVRVQHADKEVERRLTEHFGCHVAYGDRDNALRYEALNLAQPIQGADPKLLLILTQYVEQELEGLPPPGDDLGRIRWAIRRGLSTGRVNVEMVGQQCRLGTRTLQRRLAGYGLTFSGLVDLVRQEVDAELKKSGHRSQSEIAELLGFGDASALSKARHRWRRDASKRSVQEVTSQGSPER